MCVCFVCLNMFDSMVGNTDPGNSLALCKESLKFAEMLWFCVNV